MSNVPALLVVAFLGLARPVAPLPFYESSELTPSWSPVAHRVGAFALTDPVVASAVVLTALNGVADWYRPDTYARDAISGARADDPQGPETSHDPQEPGQKKRVLRGGSFMCTDQYCSRYVVGTRGKGEMSSGATHIGFRCVRSATP